MDILRSAVIDEQAVSDIDVVYAVQTCQSAGFDARIRPSADYAVDMDILEVGRPELVLGRETVYIGGVEKQLLGIARRLIGIVAVEDYGLVDNVGHHDVAYEHLFRLASASDEALEPQACIRLREGGMTAYDAPHTRRDITSQHKAAVGMTHFAGLYEEVLVATDAPRFRTVALQADPVVAHVDGGVDKEHAVTVGKVDAVAVLHVPWAADSDAVDDQVFTVERVYVEARRVLEGRSAQQHTTATGKLHKIVSHLLLFLWRLGNIRIARGELPGIPQQSIVGNVAALLQQKVPLHVAHLAALGIVPAATIAVDGALAGDGDVVAAVGRDAGHAAPATVEMSCVEAFVG